MSSSEGLSDFIRPSSLGGYCARYVGSKNCSITKSQTSVSFPGLSKSKFPNILFKKLFISLFSLIKFNLAVNSLSLSSNSVFSLLIFARIGSINALIVETSSSFSFFRFNSYNNQVFKGSIELNILFLIPVIPNAGSSNVGFLPSRYSCNSFIISSPILPLIRL